MTEKLLPCPFCGGPAAIKYWRGGEESGRQYSVACEDWACPSKTSSDDPSIVADAWNRRAAPDALQSTGGR